jgi:plasmid stability protein
MSKNIQLRNVPDELHRELKARAALAGMSLSDYLISYARQLVSRPSAEVMRARLSAREPVVVEERAAEILRAERDGP